MHYSRQTQDGYFLMSACLDSKPMLREGNTGDWIGSFIGHKGAVWSARLNHDATIACTASGDFSVKLWNALTGEDLVTLTHKHIVKTACFSADSKVMLTGGKEKKIRIYDVENPETPPAVIAMPDSIQQILAPTDPNLMFSCGDGKSINVLDLRTKQVQRTIATNAPVTYLHLSADDQVLSAAAGSELLFFDANTFAPLKTIPMARQTDCVAYHPQAGKVITGSQESWCRVYDYKSGEEIGINKGHHAKVRCVDFAPDGLSYATGSEDGTIRIWDEKALLGSDGEKKST
jgi:serine-threonine kinase receptor-associated protein